MLAFVRDTHCDDDGADGEAMVEFAAASWRRNERAERDFAGSELRGRLRFGASEDFVTSLSPDVLRQFVRSHPLVEFELNVGLSGELNEKVGAASLTSSAPSVLRERIADAWSGATGWFGCPVICRASIHRHRYR